MRLMLLQFVSPHTRTPKPVFHHHQGTLAAILAHHGHHVAGHCVGAFDPASLRKAIIHHRPAYVLADLPLAGLGPARRTLVEIAERYRLPVAVFGRRATCQPGRSLGIPGVRAVFVGEPDAAVGPFFRRMESGDDPAGTPGTWVASEDGFSRGGLAPLPDRLDALPMPDRDLFAQPGAPTAEPVAGIKAARGCPRRCAHCVNRWYMDLYAGLGPFVRHRSPEHVLEEIARVTRKQPGVRRLRFYDHAFAARGDWFEQFAMLYPRRFRLPYLCHVRLGDVTPLLAEMLRGSGCREVRTQVGSGNRFIREEILGMSLSDEQILAAADHLRKAGLRVVADVLLGCPYESPVTLEQAESLLREARFTRVEPALFHPTPGTHVETLCRDNGWLRPAAQPAGRPGRSAVHLPALDDAALRAAMRRLAETSASGGALRALLRRLGIG